MLPDPLSDLLSLLKPDTYVAGGFDLAGAWSVRFDAHNGVKCYAVLKGGCWILLDGHPDAVRLDEGDCVLLPDGRSFILTSDPALQPVPFADLQQLEFRGGIATLGAGGETFILGGHFAFGSAQGDLLLGEMPPITRLQDDREASDLRWALERMRVELSEQKPGGVLVAQHIAHIMLVQALRLYLAGAAGRHHGWLFALADPRLAMAIRAMHADPARQWTLDDLAREAAMSRSRFARSFADVVGLSPIAYLTRWRMVLAGAHLSEGSLPISAIARASGYDSDSAFSAAFRRVMNCSPREFGRIGRPVVVDHPWPLTVLARRSAG